MKKTTKNLIILFIGLAMAASFSIYAQEDLQLGAAPVLHPVNGGTGTSTKPTIGQILVGSSTGLYSLEQNFATTSVIHYLTQFNQFSTTSANAWLTNSGTTTIKYMVAASNAPAATKRLADYVATGSNDDVVINAAIIAAASSTVGSGIVELSEGTFTTSAKIFNITAGIHLRGKGARTTTINSSATDYGIQFGNRQVTNLMRNNMGITDLQINMSNEAATGVKIDGGGQGGFMNHISSNDGKYNFELEDLDRWDIKNLYGGNPNTACVRAMTGEENTWGKVKFDDVSCVLDATGTIGWLWDTDWAYQTAPNSFEAVEIHNSLMYANTGLVTTGMQFNVGMKALLVTGTQFENNEYQVKFFGTTTAQEVNADFQANSFINSGGNSTDIFQFNNYTHNLTFHSNTLQQADNVFNGVSGFSNVVLEGINNDEGNLTNKFTGQFASKRGTDTSFTGDNLLSSGISDKAFASTFSRTVLIGTSSTAFKLGVEGTSALGNSAFAGFFRATTTTASSTFAGSVGVGTTTPFASFSVTGTNNRAQFVVSSSTNANTSILVDDKDRLFLGTGTGDVAFTNTSTTTFAGPVTLSGWALATSTVVCFYPETCQYPISRTSTSSQSVINLAMLNTSNAGGGEVILKLVGTSTISDLIQVPSNVNLKGQGIGVTVIKADVNYNPSTACPSGGRCMVIAKNSSVSNVISNVKISGITFDGNGVNIAGISPSSLHRLFDVYYTNNWKLEDIKVYNALSWAVHFRYSDGFWIRNSTVLAGWSRDLNQQDGIHLRGSQNCWIDNNYVNTKGNGTSGDDTIVLLTGSIVTQNMENCEVSNNTLLAGSHNVTLGAEGNNIIQRINIHDNISLYASSTAIDLLHYDNDTSGIMRDVTIDNNKFFDFGANGTDGDCIRLEQVASPRTLSFEDITITNNTCKKGGYTGGGGILAQAKTKNLKINNNHISDITGIVGIKVGNTNSPITGVCSINGNTIDLASSSSNVKGIRMIGTTGCEVIGNSLVGTTTGTSYAIALEAGAGSGLDLNGLPSAEVSSYNDVSHNTFKDFDNGPTEINSGASPDNNQFSWNTFNNIATAYTLLGASSVSQGDGSTIRSRRYGVATQYIEIDGGTAGGPYLTCSSATGLEKSCSFLTQVTGGGITTATIFDWQIQGVEKMRMSSTGKLGIGSTGTTSPWAMLSVEGNASLGSTTVSSLVSTSTATSTFAGGIGIGYTDALTNASLESSGALRASRSGTQTQYVEMISNTSNGMFVNGRSAGAGKNLVFDQSISGASASTPATIFAWTIQGVEKMRLTNLGKLGIGTTSPYAKLSIVGDLTGTSTIAFAPAVAQTANIVDIFSNANPALLTDVISATNKWGIGTTTPAFKLAIEGTTALGNSAYVGSLKATSTVVMTGLTGATGGTNQDLCIAATTGNLVNETTGTCIVSSERFKHNIEPLDLPALDLIHRLKLVSFTPNDDDSSDFENLQYGFTAEGVALVDPHFAKYGLDGLPRNLDDRALLNLSFQGITELDEKTDSIWINIKNIIARILGLENKIKTLEKKNADLEKRLEALEKK